MSQLKTKIDFLRRYRYPLFRLHLHCAMSRSRRAESKRRRRVLVLPPDKPGSVGDEAMVLSTLARLRTLGADRITLIDLPSEQGNWQSMVGSRIDSTLELPGYFENIHAWNTLHSFVDTLQQFDYFYCLGADLMDGGYHEYTVHYRTRLLDLAARSGVNTALLGFSFNADPHPNAVGSLKGLHAEVRLCSRDPVSHRRLERMTGRRVELVADLAFLLKPEAVTSEAVQICEWIAAQRAQGCRVLGINASAQACRADPQVSLEDVLAGYVNTLTRLAATEKLSLVFVPHDLRDVGASRTSDYALNEQIFSQLPADLRTRSRLLPPMRAAEVKYLCGQLDLVLSGRMHFAIASLGAGTPPICLAYQGKFEGLFEHFAIEQALVTAREVAATEPFVEFLAANLRRVGQLRSQIAGRLPQITALSQSNFRDLEASV
jgi:polysaccharide pyruvyl transferase WcaK-like protein